MAQAVIVRQGFWCDVCASPTGILFAYCTGLSIGDCRTVIVELNGVERFRTLAPSTPRMLRIACSELGDVGLVGQAQDGEGLLLYRLGQWEHPCPCYAQPAIAWNDVSTVAYTQISGTQYVRVTEGVVSNPIDVPIGLTSAGISQILDDGTPVWAQNTRSRTIRGTTLTVTMEIHGIVTGQLEGFVGGIPVDAGDPFVALDAPGMDPRLAMNRTTGIYAICSWTTNNTACYNECPPFVPVPPNPIIYPPVAEFPHAISIAPYKDLQGVSGSDSQVCIDGAMPAVGDTRMSWVGQGLDGSYDAIRRVHATGRLYGIIAETRADSKPDALVPLRALADELQTRLAWWYDGIKVVAPPVQYLKPWDQIWHEWFWYPDKESLIDAEMRWDAAWALSEATHCEDLGGIPQNFTGALSEQQAVDCLGVALTDFSSLSRLKVLAPFEFDRINGITGLASMREMYNRTLAASVHGVPTFVPAWPSPPVSRDDRLLTSFFKESQMLCTRVVGGPQLQPSGSGVAVMVTNPLDVDYLGLPPKGTVLAGGPASGPVVISVQPDGSIECRDPSARGAYEVAQKSGGFLVYSASGPQRFLVPFSD